MLHEGHEEHSLWCHLRSRARHESTVIDTRFGPVELKRGQALISYQTLSDDLGIERTKVRRCLKRWARRGLISLDASRTVNAQSSEQSAAHLNAPLPTIVTLNDYAVSEKAAPKAAQSSARSPRTSSPGTTPEGKEKTGKRRKGRTNPLPISEAQYIFQASRVAKWQQDTGGLYIGEESYECAFKREFGFTREYWEQLQQRFIAATPVAPKSSAGGGENAG
jgi:hypothetical protein